MVHLEGSSAAKDRRTLWSTFMHRIKTSTACAGLAIAAATVVAPAAALADGLTFQSQERWVEVTVPSDDSGVTRVASPGFTLFDHSLTQFGTDSNGASGKGDANQTSTLANKITANGYVSGIGGGALGSGFGVGESYFKTTFTAGSNTDFAFMFNARSFDSSVVQYFSFSLTGAGVNYSNDPDQFRLLFGQTFSMNGAGTLLAGETYTLEIDLYASGDGAGSSGEGDFAFTMTTIPAPGTALVACLGLLPATRRRR